MNTFKSLCLGILLLGASYGVYVAVNGTPGQRRTTEDAEGSEGVDVSLELPELPNEDARPQKRQLPSADSAAEHTADGPDSEAPRYVRPSGEEAAVPPAEQPSAGEPPFSARGRGRSDKATPAGYVAGAQAEAPSAQPSVDSSGTQGEDFALALENAQVLLESGRLSEALLELSRWYQDPRLAPEEQEYLVELLSRVAGTVIYSRQHLLDKPYRVLAGDTLHRVAQRYNVPWRLLAKINGIGDPDNLSAGEELKVVPGPFDAVVDLTTWEMTLFLHGRYAGRFRIGLGEDDPTPEGEYTVKSKEVNPTYYGPDLTIDQDDPENPLGELLLDLGGRVYLHATDDASSLGRQGGRGSIRLSSADMEDVFDILTSESEGGMASRVVIRR